MTKPLTKTMLSCIDFARAHGNELVRSPGGFWAHRGWRMPADGPWFGSTTVRALLVRGAVEWSEWSPSKNGRTFPIAARLK